MRDRSEQILRIACLVLAALVLVQLFRAGCHVGALVGAKIPPVPTLETNSVSATNAMAATKGSNAPLVKTVTTNSSNPAATGTNTAPDKMTSAVSTNQVSVRTNPPAIIGATNSPKKFAGETPAAEIEQDCAGQNGKGGFDQRGSWNDCGNKFVGQTTLPNSTNHVSADNKSAGEHFRVRRNKCNSRWNKSYFRHKRGAKRNERFAGGYQFRCRSKIPEKIQEKFFAGYDDGGRHGSRRIFRECPAKRRSCRRKSRRAWTKSWTAKFSRRSCTAADGAAGHRGRHGVSAHRQRPDRAGERGRFARRNQIAAHRHQPRAGGTGRTKKRTDDF